MGFSPRGMFFSIYDFHHRLLAVLRLSKQQNKPNGIAGVVLDLRAVVGGKVLGSNAEAELRRDVVLGNDTGVAGKDGSVGIEADGCASVAVGVATEVAIRHTRQDAPGD